MFIKVFFLLKRNPFETIRLKQEFENSHKSSQTGVWEGESTRVKTLRSHHISYSPRVFGVWKYHFFSKLLFKHYDIAKLVLKKDRYNIANFILYKKKNPPDGRFFKSIYENQKLFYFTNIFY